MMVGRLATTSGLAFVEADWSRPQSLVFHASFVAEFGEKFWFKSSFAESSGRKDVRLVATGGPSGWRGRSGRGMLLFCPSKWIVMGRGSPARRGFGGGGCEDLLS